MSINVVQFPELSMQSVPDGLRKLADQIDAGEFGDAHNLAWVIDEGEAALSVGLLGKCPEPAPTAYFLYGLAMRKLEMVKP